MNKPQMLKRIFDLLLSFAGGLFFLPWVILIAILIKLEDGGPVFFNQKRWGKHGKVFEAYKFRSMIQDADRIAGFRPASREDVRITKVGKFLRATAMDELPQLMNIFLGDMSFVGPRALAYAEVSPNEPRFDERHQIAPGLTGPAQIYGSRDATLQQKFDYDIKYIKNHSLFYDIRLMFISVWVTLRGKWESREKKF